MEGGPFRWWNSQLEGATDLDRPPEIVDPSIAHGIFSRICPIFLLFVIDERDRRSYWESIQAIVTMFNHTGEVPNPLIDFPAFVCKTFSLMHVMSPRTVEDCVEFIDRFGFRDAAHFFLYQSPVFFSDPVLYLDTMIELRERRHALWTSFICKPSLVDAFFEMYGSFIIPMDVADESFWRHRVLITEVLCDLVLDVFHIHENITQLAAAFLDMTIPLLRSPANMCIMILRCILSIISSLTNTMPKEQLQVRIMKVLEILDETQSPHAIMAFRFALSMRHSLVSKMHILKMVSERGIRRIEDFDIIRIVIDPVTVMPVLSLLIRTSILSKLWHRACFNMTMQIITTAGSRADMRDYVIFILKKLFIFIAAAHHRHKYHIRCLFLCESLSKITRMELPWLHQAMQGCAAAVAAKGAPEFFSRFFWVRSSMPDELALHEMAMLMASKDSLKYYPFDPKKGMLVMSQTGSKTTIPKSKTMTSIKILKKKGGLRGPTTSSVRLPKKRTTSVTKKKTATSVASRKVHPKKK